MKGFMRTVCVYHSIDLDGWMSAAIVKHWFEGVEETKAIKARRKGGILCDIKTCDLLKEYKLRELEQQLDIALKDRL